MTPATERPNEKTTIRHLMLIGGKPAESSDGRYIDIENPANRSVIGEVPRATAADVDTAVRTAAAAVRAWRLVAPRGRGRAPLENSHTVGYEGQSNTPNVAAG